MEPCQTCKTRKCVYVVDWEDHPETTGYSMYKTGWHGQYGCMRAVAMINQKTLVPCALEVRHQLQIPMLG